jgi:hypothetical protein
VFVFRFVLRLFIKSWVAIYMLHFRPTLLHTKRTVTLGGGALILHGLYSVPTFLELVLQDENFCLKKLAFAFLTDCAF